MSIAERMVAGFDHIVDGCRTVLAAVPDDKLDWRPHEKSWTMGELGSHIANLPNWAMATLAHSEFDVSPVDGDPPKAPVYHSASELVQALDANAASAKDAIGGASDDDLRSSWTMLVAGEPRFTIPKAVVLRGFILDHMVHHRAQLGVYLRLLDVPVPQTFGPTADFPDM